MLDQILDWLTPLLFVIVAVLAILLPERDGRERNMKEAIELYKIYEEDVEICYNAFCKLTFDEFLALPNNLKWKVPDKCNFCRWVIECDPLEMALAKGEYCGGFEERRWEYVSSIKDK